MLLDRKIRRILAVSFTVCVTVVLSVGTASAHGAGDTGSGHSADSGGQQADVADTGSEHDHDAHAHEKSGCSMAPDDTPAPVSLAIAIVGLAAARLPRNDGRTG